MAESRDNRIVRQHSPPRVETYDYIAQPTYDLYSRDMSDNKASEKSKVTVVLGASANPERYSHKAVVELAKHGHHPIPVHPSGKAVAGVNCLRNLSEIVGPVDTVTLYLGPTNSSPLIEHIIACKPKRLICNPGAENPTLEQAAAAAGIEVVEGCTLVMLRTNTY